MNKFKSNVFLTVAMICGLMLFAGCGSKTATNNATSNTAVVTSADSVGVPECDEYIKKYEACLTSIAAKAPQAQPSLKTAFEQQRNAFKQAAATEQGKASLGTTCKQAIETAKQSTAAYSCSW